MKNKGTNKTERIVAAIIPPNTPVPIECLLDAPAPLAATKGTTPRMNAIEVMRMGRNRSRAASIAASRNERPAAGRSAAGDQTPAARWDRTLIQLPSIPTTRPTDRMRMATKV